MFRFHEHLQMEQVTLKAWLNCCYLCSPFKLKGKTNDYYVLPYSES